MQSAKTIPNYDPRTERGATRRARRAAFRAEQRGWYVDGERAYSAELLANAWRTWLRAQAALCSPSGADILSRVRLEKMLGQNPLAAIQRILFIDGRGDQADCEILAAEILTALEHGNPDVAQARAVDSDGPCVVEWDVDMNMWMSPPAPEQQDDAGDATQDAMDSEFSAAPAIDEQAGSINGVPHICLPPRILAQRPIAARVARAC